jgi:hypothetical protein
MKGVSNIAPFSNNNNSINTGVNKKIAPEQTEGLIIPDGVEVTSLHLVLLDILWENLLDGEKSKQKTNA